MKIARLKIQNYRSIEEIDLLFPSYYSAICGKNDSGKTNIIRAMRSLMEEESPYRFSQKEEFSFKDDYTKWRTESDRKQIYVGVDIVANRQTDAGLYEFMTTYLSLKEPGETLGFRVEVVFTGETPAPETSLEIGPEKFSGIKAQEVLKKLQSSHSMLFHNSTETDPQIPFRGRFSGFLSEFYGRDSAQVEKLKKNVNRSLSRIAKRHQTSVSELLGRLEGKYKVGMSLHTFDLGYLPFNITLGDRKIAFPLNDWGSGTRNRTLILMTLLRARQISQGGASASKITPIIIIEEPESFLHPSAQAEFGGILQDLSEEFQVQVLATTHSPYMLSQDKPSSNVLLERKVIRKQLRQTYRVETIDTNWMEPFGRALGVDNKIFEPWKDLFFSKSDCILLVEGDTDREYFELLRDPAHCSGQLNDSVEIFSYDGRDNLKHAVLLKFIKEKYKKVFITFDLDSEADVGKYLTPLGFRKNEHYCAIGLNSSGKKNIEGLVPESVTSKVYAAHPALVQQAMNGTREEKESAKNRIKRLVLDKFKSEATPGDSFFKRFYDISRIVNKGLR